MSAISTGIKLSQRLFVPILGSILCQLGSTTQIHETWEHVGLEVKKHQKGNKIEANGFEGLKQQLRDISGL